MIPYACKTQTIRSKTLHWLVLFYSQLLWKNVHTLYMLWVFSRYVKVDCNMFEENLYIQFPPSEITNTHTHTHTHSLSLSLPLSLTITHTIQTHSREIRQCGDSHLCVKRHGPISIIQIYTILDKGKLATDFFPLTSVTSHIHTLSLSLSLSLSPCFSMLLNQISCM